MRLPFNPCAFLDFPFNGLHAVVYLQSRKVAFHSFVFDVLRVFIVAVSKSSVHGCTLYQRHESSVVRTRTSLFGPSGWVHAPFLDVAWQPAPVPDRLLM